MVILGIWYRRSLQNVSPESQVFLVMSGHSRALIRQLFSPLLSFLKNLFIYLSIFGCVGSSFLCKGFLQLRQAGATLHHGARASHCHGLSCCGAQAPDAQAQ